MFVVCIQMHIVSYVGSVYVTQKRTFLVILCQNIPDACRGELKCRQSIFVELYLYGLFASAINIHSRNTINVFELRLYVLVYNGAQTVHSACASHLQSHKVVVHAVYVGSFDVHREAIGQGGDDAVYPLLQFQSSVFKV